MSIVVKFEVAGTAWKHNQMLKMLEKEPLLGLDTETSGVYTKQERKQAKLLLSNTSASPKLRRQYSLIANNSGLSFPSLVKVTHFILGICKDYSVVLVTSTPAEELRVWKWISNFQGHLVIHNSLFDLKIMHHRIKKLPKNYTDTALLAKCLLNSANNFDALIGLKELMGNYYKPEWNLFTEYEPENLFDPRFLEYSATDGAALIHLWEDLEEEELNEK